MTSPHIEDLTRARLAYLMRGLWRRVQWDNLPARRRASLSVELSEQLFPCAISERTTLGWLRSIANRFEIQLPAGDRFHSPATALVHERFIDDAMATELATEQPNHRRVRWDVLVEHIDFDALRLVLHHGGGPLIATFAASDPHPSDDQLFSVRTPQALVTPFAMPADIIATRSHSALITVLTGVHHGHDEKTGNVSLFRRQRTIDPTTGETGLVPFISGNAVRGAWRDLAFFRLFSLLGITAADLPPQRAHAMLSGGTIEAGADTSKVDNGIRNYARAICPPWDLLAGTIDKQIMGSTLAVFDAEIVCRENAWKLHRALGGGASLEDFRASLRPANDFTQLRLLTRHAHRDVPESDGSQMIVNVELLLPGTQIHHAFAWRAESARSTNEVTRSCLADLIEQFRANGHLGAKQATMGSVSMTEYEPRGGASALPTSDIYLDFVDARRDEIISWLMEATTRAAGEVAVAAQAEKPRGKGKRANTNGKLAAEEMP